MNFDAARDAQQVWKHQQIQSYITAFLRAGLQLYAAGINYVGSDDVEVDTEGAGIAGSAVAAMRNASLIRDYFGTHREEGIYGGRRKSKRPSANARKVPVYSLVSIDGAEHWLRDNGAEMEPRQKELQLGNAGA